MYAAHFTAGLALGARAPRAPMWALLAGAFLPDVVWIGLSCAGAEPAGTGVFFDDWSHSLVSVLILATLFALCFVREGRGMWLAVWLAVASHLVLDAPIHPRPLALYPHAAIHLPWDLWHWGEAAGPLGFSHYWWVQLTVTLVLLAVYVAGMRRRKLCSEFGLGDGAGGGRASSCFLEQCEKGCPGVGRQLTAARAASS